MKRTYTKGSPYGQAPFPGQTVNTGFPLPSTADPGVSESAKPATMSDRRYSRSGDVTIQEMNGHDVKSRAPFVSPSGTGSTLRYPGHSSAPYARPFPLPKPTNGPEELS